MGRKSLLVRSAQGSSNLTGRREKANQEAPKSRPCVKRIKRAAIFLEFIVQPTSFDQTFIWI
jgi:hypothetical protein